MRIDVHAYIGHWPYRRLTNNTVKGLLRQMERYDIDQSWVGNINGLFYKNCQESNEELAEAVNGHEKRVIPFGTINPTYAAWERDLEHSVRNLGMSGMRLYPQYHGYACGDDACLAAVRACAALNVPVAFTVRMTDERQRSWLDSTERLDMNAIADTIRAVSEARYLVLHAFPQDIKGQLPAGARVLFDTLYATGVPVGFISAYPLGEATARFGAERFALGTAAPFRDYESALLRIETNRDASPAETQGFWYANAEQFLRKTEE